MLDRINRRTVSIASDLISAAAVAALPLTASLTELNLGWFILFGFLGAFGDIPGMTARDTMLPAIARAARIAPERLIGIGQGVGGLMVVIGPAAAGTLFLLLDGIGALWVTAATSALAAILTLFLPRSIGVDHGGDTADAALGPVAQLLASWRHLFSGASALWRIVCLGLVGMGALIAFQGTILPAHFAFGTAPAGLGFALTGFALGTMLGGGIFAWLGSRGSRGLWLGVGSLGAGVTIVGVAMLPGMWWIVGLMCLAGALISLQGGVITAMLLEQVPEHMRGRILGTQNALLLILGPLVMFGTAAAAEFAGLVPAGVGVAVLALLGTAALLLTLGRAALQNAPRAGAPGRGSPAEARGAHTSAKAPGISPPAEARGA